MESSEAATGHCVIDLDPGWVESLCRKVDDTSHRDQQRRVDPRTIFKVPVIYRDANPDAYTPKVISIGPYHRNDPHLKSMDRLKLRFLRKILARNPGAKLEDYLKTIKTLETRARSLYSENTAEIGSNEFVEMLLLDGCFIVKILLMQHDEDEEDLEDEEDPIKCTLWALGLIERDMLMLENQIPFFVLESLFCLATAATPYQNTRFLLIKHVVNVFGDLLPGGKAVCPGEMESVPKFYHILHLFHSLILPKKEQGHSSSLSTPESVPSATGLQEAGVKFKKEDAGKSFLDVTFENGVMTIPTLQVYDDTSALFRNLIAFEQCFPKVGTYVATYAVMMDCLVDRAEDVALLHWKGCIVNGLGSDEAAAELFNHLCKEVAIHYDSSYLAPLFRNVKKHCDSKWNRYRAKLMHDYFSNPWVIFSLAGALIIIIVTVIQTGFAILAYFRPPN